MKRLIFTLLVLMLCILNLKSQNTVIIKPDSEAGKDAILRSLTPTTNYGWHPDLTAEATTTGGSFVAIRSIIDFNLTQIPTNALITEAKLYLYSYNSPSTGQHMGNNVCYLQRITSNWDENTVTWNSTPNTTTQNQVILAASTLINQNYIIDVKNLVQDYINDTANSYGFMLRLVDESIFRKMIFASSDNNDTNLRPKIEITYILNNNSINDKDFENPVISIYPNPASNFVNLKYNLKESCNVSFEILNVLGQIVLVKDLGFKNLGNGNHNLVLDDNFDKGLYIVKMKFNNKISISKFIKD